MWKGETFLSVTSGAEARIIVGLNRRHECLLHPVEATDQGRARTIAKIAKFGEDFRAAKKPISPS